MADEIEIRIVALRLCIDCQNDVETPEHLEVMAGSAAILALMMGMFGHEEGMAKYQEAGGVLHLKADRVTAMLNEYGAVYQMDPLPPKPDDTITA